MSQKNSREQIQQLAGRELVGCCLLSAKRQFGALSIALSELPSLRDTPRPIHGLRHLQVSRAPLGLRLGGDRGPCWEMLGTRPGQRLRLIAKSALDCFRRAEGMVRRSIETAPHPPPDQAVLDRHLARF